MIILRIEHKVPNYEGWKKAFESDPINRRQSGVRRHRIFRPTDDPNYVIVELEFDNINSAELTLSALRKVWSRVEGTIMFSPQTRIFDVAETMDY